MQLLSIEVIPFESQREATFPQGTVKPLQEETISFKFGVNFNYLEGLTALMTWSMKLKDFTFKAAPVVCMRC